MRDFRPEVLSKGESPPTRFDNNEPPSVQFVPVPEEFLAGGLVPIRYRIFDHERNPADLEVEVDLGDGLGFRPALEFPSHASDGHRGLATLPVEEEEPAGKLPFHTFLWDALSQAHGAQPAVLRFRARDREPGPAAVLAVPGRSLFLTEEFPAGKNPQFPTTGDYNGNGFLDALVTNFDSDDATFLKGGPRGLFPSGNSIPAGDGRARAGPHFVTSGDFNGDGIQDAAIVNFLSKDVTCLMGTSLGLVPLPNRWPLATRVSVDHQAATGDCDGDRLDDVVIANREAGGIRGTITYLRGDASGVGLTFCCHLDAGPQTRGLASLSSLRLPDFDGDGRSDALVTNRLSNDANYLRGTEKGFTLVRTIKVGSRPELPIAADFSGDGLPDALVPNSATNGTVTLLYAVAEQGIVDQPERMQEIAVGDGPLGAEADDYDGDGFLDAVVNLWEGGALVFLKGGPGGLTGEARPIPTAPFPIAHPKSGHFDGDGYPDVLASHAPNNRVTFLRGGPEGLGFAGEVQVALGTFVILSADFDRDGFPEALLTHNDRSLDQIVTDEPQFQQVTYFRSVQHAGLVASGEQFRTGARPAALAAADFDRDGSLDALAANEGSSNLSYLEGRHGGFSVRPALEVGPGPRDVKTADLNGDSFPDALAAVFDADRAVFLPGGPGGLSAEAKVELLAGKSPREIWLGDLDLDGISDAAVANWGSGDVTLFRGGRPEPARWGQNVPVGDAPIALLGGDFNGDGLLDLAAACWGSGEIAILDGVVGGLSREARRLPSGHFTTALTGADYDGDGFLDLLAVNWGAHDVACFHGGPKGLRSPVRARVGLFPRAAASGDLDADGFPDAAVINSGSETVTLLRGGPRGLEPAGETTLESPPGDLAIADFDGDGRLDLLATASRHDYLSFQRGGPGGSSSEVQIAVGTRPNRILPRDFDGDGFLDVLVSNGSDDLTFLRQRYATAHATLLTDGSGTEGPRVVLDPRNPPRYRLEVPPGAFPSPTQVAVVPTPIFDLPQGTIATEGKLLRAATGTFTVVARGDAFQEPLQLTLLLREGERESSPEPGRLLVVITKGEREPGAGRVGERETSGLKLTDLGRGKGVSFPVYSPGVYIVAEVRDR